MAKNTISAAGRAAAKQVTNQQQIQANTEGILSKAKRMSLSAIGGFFGGIDTLSGASSIRDVLAGENPFDQFLTPFSDQNKVSGRQVLTKWGVTSKNKPTGLSWNDGGELLQDVMGFAADVALDPTSYLTAGVSKAGQVGAKAGLTTAKLRPVAARAGATGLGKRASRTASTLRKVLAEYPDEAAELTSKFEKAAGGADELASLMDQPMGGTIGFALPFERTPRKIFTSERANRWLDRAGDAVRMAPGIKHAYQMIGGRRRGAQTEVAGTMAEDASDFADAIRGKSLMEGHNIISRLENAKFFDNYSGRQRAAEADLFRYYEGVKEAPEEIKPIIADMRKAADEAMAKNEKYGKNVERLNDDILYAPRGKVKAQPKKGEPPLKGDDLRAGRKNSVKDPHGLERAGIYKGIKDGTGQLIEATDDFIQEIAPNRDLKNAKKIFDQKYGPPIPGGYDPIRKMVRSIMSAGDKGLDLDAAGEKLYGRVAGDYLGRQAAKMYAAVQRGAISLDEFKRKYSEKNIVGFYAKNIAEGMHTHRQTVAEAVQDTFGNKNMKEFSEAWKEKFDQVLRADKEATSNARKGGVDVPNTPLRELADKAREAAMEAAGVSEEAAKTLSNRLLKTWKRDGKIDKAVQVDPEQMEKLVGHLENVLGTKKLKKQDRTQSAPRDLIKKIEDALSPKLPDEWEGKKRGQKVAMEGRRIVMAKRLHAPAVNGELPNGLFADPITSHVRMLQRSGESTHMAQMVVKTMGSDPILERAAKQSGSETVPLRNTLKELGFKTDPKSMNSAMAAILEERGLPPRVNEDILPPEAFDEETGELLESWIEKTNNAMGDMQIPKQLHDDLVRINKGFSGPEPIGEIAEAMRWATDLQKRAFTSPWPAFHGRNRFSGLLRNILRQQWSKKDSANMQAALTGKTIKGASKRYPVVAQIAMERGFVEPASRGPSSIVMRQVASSQIPMAESWDVVGGYNYMADVVVDGKVVGDFALTESDDALSIIYSGLQKESRGKKIGLRAYMDLFDEAVKKGKALTSGASVSEDAQRVYSSLRRRGYKVEINPTAAPNPRLKTQLVSGDGKPVYRVTEGPRKVSDEVGTQIIKELLHSFDMTGEGQGQWIGKELGTVTDYAEARRAIHETKNATPYKDFAKGWAFRDGASFKPWEEEFGPYKGGAALGSYIEGMNRGEAFLNLLSKNVDPAEAARMVKESQVDYAGSAYSKFEQQIAGIVYPFWKFQTRNLASVTKELAQHPGGATAIAGKAIASGHDPDELTPEHIATSAAIPVGVLPDGSKRYVTGMGTMEEAAFQFLNPDLQSTLRASLSNMNPMFKWVPELAAGETFFQAGPDGGGRDLADMDPLLGRIGSNITGRNYPYKLGTLPEYIAGASPASRVLHTVRTLTDKRKDWVAAGLNTMTGLRVADVSPDAQQALLTDQVQQLMKESGGRAFTGMYFPQDMELDSHQQALKALLTKLNKTSRARREQRKKEAKK